MCASPRESANLILIDLPNDVFEHIVHKLRPQDVIDIWKTHPRLQQIASLTHRPWRQHWANKKSTFDYRMDLNFESCDPGKSNSCTFFDEVIEPDVLQYLPYAKSIKLSCDKKRIGTFQYLSKYAQAADTLYIDISYILDDLFVKSLYDTSFGKRLKIIKIQGVGCGLCNVSPPPNLTELAVECPLMDDLSDFLQALAVSPLGNQLRKLVLDNFQIHTIPTEGFSKLQDIHISSIHYEQQSRNALRNWLQKGQLGRLCTLAMCDCGLQDEDLLHGRWLEAMTHLDTICLKNNYLTHGVLDKLLSDGANLRHIVLDMNPLGELPASTWIRIQERLPQINYLSIAHTARSVNMERLFRLYYPKDPTIPHGYDFSPELFEFLYEEKTRLFKQYEQETEAHNPLSLSTIVFAPWQQMIVILALDDNDLDDSAIGRLVSPYWPALEELSLNRNNFRAVGFQVVIETHNMPRLKKLELSCSKLAGLRKRFFGEFTLSNLQHLDLGKNDLSNTDVQEIATLAGRCPMDYLNLEQNHKIDDVGAQFLVDAEWLWKPIINFSFTHVTARPNV
jgi:Leucine-rich repeat (LRR) protein